MASIQIDRIHGEFAGRLDLETAQGPGRAKDLRRAPPDLRFRDQAGDRFAPAGDDDFLAGLDTLDQRGKMRLGFCDLYLSNSGLLT
ncbi:MAG: hypothetical protein WC474_13040 [Hydrogenophilaceae bacterium]